MNRDFLEKFLDKISEFPVWAKKILYNKLSADVTKDDNDLGYVFATYKPVLTDSGKCELNQKKLQFDSNIYNILDYCDKGTSISEIAVNTYMSMEEIAAYFLFCVDEGYIQLPDDSQIFNIAGFLAGKYRTGEFFLKDGMISETQLDDAILHYEHRAIKNNKFGQSLIEMGLISKNQLNAIISFKNEAKKRFILDHNELPKVRNSIDYELQIQILKKENEQLKNQIEQLCSGEKKSV